MVIVRLSARYSGLQQIKLGWDDAILVVCWLVALPIPIVAGFLAEVGIGRDIWDFRPQQLSDFYLWFYYIEGISYSLATGEAITRTSLRADD